MSKKNVIVRLTAGFLVILLSFLFCFAEIITATSTQNTDSSKIKLLMYNGNTTQLTNTLYPRFKLVNGGSESIDLQKISISYFYTKEEGLAQNFFCDWIQKGSITGQFITLDDNYDKADTQLIINFNEASGSLAPGESVELHTRIANVEWKNYDQSNDYSFNPSATDYTEWDNALLELNGQTIWGNAPEKTTETPEPTATPDNSPAPTASPSPTPENVTVNLMMYNNNRGTENNSPSPWFTLTNQSALSIDLSKIKIRYYYTFEGDEQTQSYWCDWSNVGSSNISGKFVKLVPPMINADYYLELGFNEGIQNLAPGAGVEIQSRFSKSDWSPYTQNNDYSYNSTATQYASWNKATVYYEDSLIWGEEPREHAPIPESFTNVELKLMNANIQERSNTIFPRYILTNTGNQPISLKDVRIRYYYTSEEDKAQYYWCDWSSVGSGNITGRFQIINSPFEGAGQYLETGFKDEAGILKPGQSAEIHLRIAMENWLDYNQLNDYSFCGSQDTYIPWDKVSVFIGNELIWGDNIIFGKPTIITADAQENSILLNWIPVEGAARYDVKDNGLIVGVTTDPSFTITGLSEGTLHSCEVRAVTSTLTGNWSDTVDKWTLPGLPLAGVASKETEIEISWPEVTGATGYDIEVDGQMYEDIVSPYLHGQLEAGTAHHYKVRAKNSSGLGKWKNLGEQWTLPDKVLSIEAIPFETEMVLEWDAVIGATGYDIEADGTIIYENEQEPFVHWNLRPGTIYSYRIRARNSNGVGQWSDVVKQRTILGIIEDLEASATDSNITLKWSDVDGADFYNLEIDGEFIGNIKAPYIHSSLESGTQHIYRVQAGNGSGTGQWSEELLYWTLPGIPQNNTSSATETGATINWDDVRGAFSYEVEIDGIIIPVSGSPYIHLNLEPGTKHAYRVRGTNTSGEGAWTPYFTQWTIPYITGASYARADQTQITYTWDNVAGATGYDVLLNGKLYEDLTSPYKFSGQNPGNLYELTVRAKNSAGKGRWSESIMVWTIPDVPTNMNTTASSGAISVKWDKVQGATGYDIEVLNTAVDTAALTYYNHSGLNANTQYTYRVRAKNSSGYGFWSPSIAETTLPGIPGNITFQASDREIVLAWDSVAGAERYELEADGAVLKDIAVNEYKHSNLDPGSTHIYRIRSYNSRGYSEWSREVEAYTQLSPPVFKKATADNSSVYLEWSKVSEAVSYELEIDGILIEAGQNLSYRASNLEPDSEHSIRIRALYGTSPSLWSGYVELVTTLDAPVNTSATALSQSILIEWQMEPGATGYEIEVDGEILDNGLNSTFNHTELTPQTEHVYRIRAKSRGGTGAWSNPIKAVAMADAPSGILTQSSGDEIIIKWNSVQGAKGYELMADGSTITLSTITEYRHKALMPNSLHLYKIRAIFEKYTSEWSDTFKVWTLVGKPADPEILADSNKISLAWDKIEGASGYELEADGVLFQNLAEPLFVDTNLSPNTEYSYRVRAKNIAGTGEWSNLIKAKTSPEKPSNIRGNAESRSITVSWDAVNGAIGYDIEVDGVIIEVLSANSYVHSDLKTNTRHIYRLRSKNNMSASPWSDSVILNTVPEIVSTVKKDTTFNFVTVAPPKTGMTERIITVSYNPDELDVFDLCAITSEPETGVGAVEGTDIYILSFSPGKITYKISGAEKTVVNIIKFLSKTNNGSRITYSVE